MRGEECEMVLLVKERKSAKAEAEEGGRDPHGLLTLLAG